MRFSLQTVPILFGLLSPIAARAYTQDDLVARTMADNIGKLEWSGEVIPGQGNITLFGTDISDVLDQINVINPDYMSPKNQAIRASSQGDDVYDDMKSMYCGIFATADANNVKTMVFVMKGATRTCTTPAKMCVRWGCMNTSGIYVCNDSVYNQSLPCEYIAAWANAIVCSSNHVDSPYMSGQAFHKYYKYNVIVSYGNCNHAHDSDHPNDFPYPGVNGECCKVCRKDSHGNLGPGGWGHDGL